uniref:Uncharacterized protein n=1 Tax=Candidatus Methanogaster sp. ANME-2c ERB4 TaxID=2759911 RepID=A0A7G9Y8U3_9EURY|nr:hypothetical protein POGJBKNB_00010 [Methanosarcinales archaeon ANME-2c ERB4]
MQKRGRISLNFASLSTLRPCVISEEREDAMTQGRKDWKPQNPSESEKCYFIFLQALSVTFIIRQGDFRQIV